MEKSRRVDNETRNLRFDLKAIKRTLNRIQWMEDTEIHED